MLASGTLLFLLAGAAPLQDGAAVDQAIRKFQADYYRPGVRDEDRIQAVGALAVHRNEKAAGILAPLLAQAPVPVRIAAARALACFSGVPGAAEALLAALVHHRNTGQAARGVQVTILQALGTLRASCAAEAVDKLVESPDVWVAKAAIEAAGKIRSASSVDRLLKALVRLDGPRGDREVLEPYEDYLPLSSTLQQIIRRERRARDDPRKSQREVLREPLLNALTSITRKSFSSVKPWQEWWRTHKRNFTVPP